MDKDAISTQLKALATGDTSRGKTARLRDVFDDVELALRSGVSRALVLETLAKNGLDMTPKTFDSALSRIRARNKKQPNPTAPGSKKDAPPTSPTPAGPKAPDESAGGSHNPADLDKIFSQKPDLAALANLAKSTKRKSP